MSDVCPGTSSQKTVTAPGWRSLSAAGLFVRELSLPLLPRLPSRLLAG